MDKIKKHIQHLRSKPEDIRRQILAGALLVCMLLVVGIWALELGLHFGNGKVISKTKEDIKPFALFGSKIKSAYSNVSASVGNISQETSKDVEEIKTVSNDKVIDLIPIEQ